MTNQTIQIEPTPLEVITLTTALSLVIILVTIGILVIISTIPQLPKGGSL